MKSTCCISNYTHPPPPPLRLLLRVMLYESRLVLLRPLLLYKLRRWQSPGWTRLKSRCRFLIDFFALFLSFIHCMYFHLILVSPCGINNHAQSRCHHVLLPPPRPTNPCITRLPREIDSSTIHSSNQQATNSSHQQQPPTTNDVQCQM